MSSPLLSNVQKNREHLAASNRCNDRSPDLRFGVCVGGRTTDSFWITLCSKSLYYQHHQPTWSLDRCRQAQRHVLGCFTFCSWSPTYLGNPTCPAYQSETQRPAALPAPSHRDLCRTTSPLTTGLHRLPLPQPCQRLIPPDPLRRPNAGGAPRAFWRNDSCRLSPQVYLQWPPRIRCLRSSLKSPRCERRSTRTANLPLLPSILVTALLPPHLDPRPSSSRTLASASPWNTATTRSALALPRHPHGCLPTSDPRARNALFAPFGIRTVCYNAGPPAAARRNSRLNRHYIAAASSGTARQRPGGTGWLPRIRCLSSSSK
jgi:hypothetical protein